MSYSINTMSDEELDKANLLEDGTYDFEVAKAERQTSKSGNPMVKLSLRVWDKQGAEHYIYDYLVFSHIAFCNRKIKHFCQSTGIEEDYKKGNIREELEHLSGKVLIGYQESQPKKGGGDYPAKNVVNDYVTVDNAQQTLPTPKVNVEQPAEFSDDLPF